MKKAIILIFMIIGFAGTAQSLQKYTRDAKLTSAEINNIDISRTDVVYKVFNTDLGIYVINLNDAQGWVPLVAAGGVTDAQIAAGFLNIYPDADLNGTDDFSGDYNDLINVPGYNTSNNFLSIFLGDVPTDDGGMLFYWPQLNAFGNGNSGYGKTFFNGNNFGFVPADSGVGEGYQFIGTPTEIVDILLPATGTVDLTNIGTGGNDSGQGFAYVEKTTGTEEIYNDSDITLTGSATGKKLYNNHITNNATIVLGAGITLYNQTWLEATEDAQLTIKKGSGATFILDGVGLNADDGITIPEFSTVSIIALSSNKFRIWVNEYNSYQEILSLYDTANAISVVNEDNTVIDLSVLNLGNTNTVNLGVLSNQVGGTGTSTGYLSGLNGDAILMIKPPNGLAAGTYTISIDVNITTSSTGAYFYVNGGDEWSFKGVDQQLVNTNGTWETLTLTSVIYDGYVDGNSGRVRVYLPSTMVNTDSLKFDNLIWLEDE